MKNTMKWILMGMLMFAVITPAYAHCEIPCGIYGDSLRIELIREHVTTIEKSMKMIDELSKDKKPNYNQLVRWVMNKEQHAQKIIDTITDYFLTQRVNPSQKDYAERLIKHHSVILAAMKVKQNADVKYAKDLKESIEALSAYYPENKH